MNGIADKCVGGEPGRRRLFMGRVNGMITNGRKAQLWKVSCLATLAMLSGASLYVLSTSSSLRPDWALTACLLVLATFCEFQPIHFQRQGIRMSFAMPFIAGICITANPWIAASADVIAVVVVFLIGIKAPVKATQLRALALNLVVGLAVTLCAGAAFTSIASLGPSREWTYAGTLAFSFTYLTLNLAVVLAVRRPDYSRSFAGHGVRVAQVAAGVLTMYCLLGVSVAVLLAWSIGWLLPAILAPAALLRRIIQLKTSQIDGHYEAVLALTIMLQRAHPYTHGHLHRVAELAEEVALNLGLSARKARLVREAAVLHDIGKIAVDEGILDKPGKLTAEEFEHVKSHCSMGADILEQSDVFRPLAPWVRCHHERPDGNGYPDRLENWEIPVESKIIAVVDAYDAMVGGNQSSERRPYRDPVTIAEALRELERCAGTQFDQKVVAAFGQVLKRGRPSWT